jgi:ribosomal protein L10
MAELHHSGTAQETALRQAAVIQGMVADLERTIRILNIDISAEVQRVGVLDTSDPAYPILARTLGARRDNLKLTVAALVARLMAIDPRAAQDVATAA